LIKTESAGSEENPLFKEARSLLNIRNPNVIQLLGLERFNEGEIGLVLEYVEGINLSQLFHLSSPTQREAVFFNIAEQLLLGINAAHQARIIHGDLSPKNVLISLEGVLKIGDFGLSCPSAKNNLQQNWGTPGYLSAHRTETGEISHSDDLFAAGAILLEWLAGVNIFKTTLTQRSSLDEVLSFLSDPIACQLIEDLIGIGELKQAKAGEILSKYKSIFDTFRNQEGFRKLVCRASQMQNQSPTMTCLPKRFQQPSRAALSFVKSVSVILAALIFCTPVIPAQTHAFRNQPLAELDVNAYPWAQVFIDGNKRGQTPLHSEKLRPGLHHIVLKFERYRERFSVLLYPGKKLVIERGAPQQASKKQLRRMFRFKSLRNARKKS
jgi:serine/threonine protein kinase